MFSKLFVSKNTKFLMKIFQMRLGIVKYPFIILINLNLITKNLTTLVIDACKVSPKFNNIILAF